MMTNIIAGSTGNATTMSSREIASIVSKRHDNVKRTIESLIEQQLIVRPQIEDEQLLDAKGRLRKETVFHIGERDSFVVVARLSPEFTAKLVDYWHAHKSKKFAQLPNFNNPIEAARAWADECEGRMIAEQTKAEIGARREATAMNTASQAAKKAKKLELELDRSTEYSSVKRMEKIHKGESFPWRRLKTISERLGIEPKKIHDANYGHVNTYHAEVWREAYAIEINGSAHSAGLVQ